MDSEDKETPDVYVSRQDQDVLMAFRIDEKRTLKVTFSVEQARPIIQKLIDAVAEIEGVQ